jgi:radical SAM superfamily enzyme YgiQ (UPF0313 family)
MFDNIFENTDSRSVIRSILSALHELNYVIVGGSLSDLDTDELYEVHDLFRGGDSDEAILYLEDRGIELNAIGKEDNENSET